MQDVASFQVDHLRLKPGIYVSRKDKFGDVVLTTFDLRFKEPNREPVMDMPILHTLEHLGAVFLRSHKDFGKRMVYIGPMGCRTGSYLIMEGDYKSNDILPLMLEMCEWINKFEGAIPAAAAANCGNWREHNLDMTKLECRKYADILRKATGENLNYPSDLE